MPAVEPLHLCMSNNFIQLYVHLIFSVAHRDAVIANEFADELYRYMAGILKKYGHTPVIINGMPDHVHVLTGLHPAMSVSDTVKQLKQSSSYWINEHRLVRGLFRWQNGYGAFSYGASQIDAVVGYIRNQQEHHRRRTFQEEYRDFLIKYGITEIDHFMPKALMG